MNQLTIDQKIELMKLAERTFNVQQAGFYQIPISQVISVYDALVKKILLTTEMQEA